MNIYNVRFSINGRIMGGLIEAETIDDVISKFYNNWYPRVPFPGVVIKSVDIFEDT